MDASTSSAEQVAGPGQPLGPALRRDMEQRFGRDFENVRVHVDGRAAHSAAAIGAKAYTLGQHVVFREGAFNPASGEGRQLIAHELAHTVQQRSAGAEPAGHAPMREGQADRAANQVLGGRGAPALTRSGVAVAREPSDEKPSREWIDGQILLVNQQLQMPLLPPPMKAMLLLRLRELEMQRARSVPGVRAAPAPTNPALPRRCVLSGNRTPTPAAIDAKLAEVQMAETKLWTAVNMPGPMTYEQAVPQLRELELVKIQLLECGVSLGPKPGSTTTKAEASYAQQSQEALNREAVRLGEKQFERKAISHWDKLSHGEMVALDLYEERHRGIGPWGKETRDVLREPMISTIENELDKNAQAHSAYRKKYSDLENQPEEESTIHKLIGGDSFICRHTFCGPIIDQFRKDREGGMSKEDAIIKNTLFGVLPMILPSKGGPGDLIPLGGERPPLAPNPVIPTEPPVIAEPPVPPVRVEPPVVKTTPDPAVTATPPAKPVITAHADQGGVVLNEVKPADVTGTATPKPSPKVQVDPRKQTVGQRRYVTVDKPKPQPKVVTDAPPKPAPPPKVSGTTPATPTRIKPDNVTVRPTGKPSPHDVDVLEQPGARAQKVAYPSAHQHHVFPQELRAWFAERFAGLKEDIHEYTVYLSEGEHSAIHSRGEGQTVRVRGEGGTAERVKEPDLKGWNKEWKDFKNDHPQATPQEIFEEAGRLMDKYGISDAEIARYRGTKKK